MGKQKRSKRFYCDVGGQVVKCSDCKHRIGITVTCEAFPEGIPIAEIVNKEGECKNGIQYEPKGK